MRLAQQFLQPQIAANSNLHESKLMKKLNCNLKILSVLTLGVLSASQAFALSYNGWVTPTYLTYNFTGLNLNNAAGTATSLISTPFSVTFKRTDTDFVSVKIQDVSVPFGRYVSVGLCQTGTVIVNLNGVKYDGKNNTSGLNFGDTLYTKKADNSAGSVATSGPAVDLSFTGGNGAGCSAVYFPSPVCVTDSSQSGCQANDLIYTSSGSAANATGKEGSGYVANATLKVNLLVDLYDSVTLDGTSTGMNVVLVPNVLAVIGDPGAAVHLNVKATASTDAFNGSFLFGADKSLLAGTLSQAGGATGGTPLANICQGGNNVAVTATPNGSVTQQYAHVGSVSTSANSSQGQIQMPTVSSCQSLSSCNSAGVSQISKFIQAAGNNATIKCIADTSATPSMLGYTYTGGTGGTNAGTANSANIVRIVDPKNIFGVCSSSPCYDATVAPGGYY